MEERQLHRVILTILATSQKMYPQDQEFELKPGVRVARGLVHPHRRLLECIEGVRLELPELTTCAELLYLPEQPRGSEWSSEVTLAAHRHPLLVL